MMGKNDVPTINSHHSDSTRFDTNIYKELTIITAMYILEDYICPSSLSVYHAQSLHMYQY
jgi:hypothetical protein